MPAFHAGDSGANPERATRTSQSPGPHEIPKTNTQQTGPPNALADERRSFKPVKQVRYLTGALKEIPNPKAQIPMKSQEANPNNAGLRTL